MKEEQETKKAIKALKTNLRNQQSAIFKQRDLEEIVLEHVPDVGANQRALIKGQLLDYLWKNNKLREVAFKFPSRKETRYILGKVSPFELAQSLKPDAYLVYSAAMFVNGICKDVPETIHINVEQSQHHKRNKTSLTQDAIDRAFRNKARISNEVAEANGVRVCVTHGQKTDQLGVITKKGANKELLRVTDLERCLVDISVRPIYAGGTKNVLKGFRAAWGLLSTEKLLKTLKQMNFVYPYHQCIGFYLEMSGACSESELALFEEIDKEFDFYLDYRMHDPSYSERWKLYYPKELMKD
jgi:predicted transcriptional regulator of viral defense system